MPVYAICSADIYIYIELTIRYTTTCTLMSLSFLMANIILYKLLYTSECPFWSGCSVAAQVLINPNTSIQCCFS